LGGGFTFGLYADVIIMAENAFYAGNFIKHGFTPGMGATYLFPKRLGSVLGPEMLYAGRNYSGRELKERGAPIEIVQANEVTPRALVIAREMAQHPLLQLKLMKRRMTEEIRRGLAEAVEAEVAMHKIIFSQPGRAARTEDRAPMHALSQRQSKNPAAPGTYETLQVMRSGPVMEVRINRGRRNSINDRLIAELEQALDEAERDADVRLFVLAGKDGVFCTGMDLEAASSAPPVPKEEGSAYMSLLKRFAQTKRVVIAKVDGAVLAGGVGLVAASDLVYASSKATFALSEALFGLLPAQVAPFLVRRVGFQDAYTMTLTARTLSAEEAAEIGLIDVLAEDLDAEIQANARRLSRLDPHIVADLKAYFRRMWILTEEMERTAVNEFTRLMRQPRVQQNIREFVEHGQLPWERS
jgi:polyketide biosynthesis enoyl-CoA hydratase PksH